MIKNLFLFFVFLLLTFFVYSFDIIYSYSNNSIFNIYNIEYGDKFIVYEYEKIYNDKSYHYIGLLYDDGVFFDIKSNNGEIINSDMYFPSLSNDSKYLTFTSRATNITNDDLNECYDILNGIFDNCSNIYVYDVLERKSFLMKNGNEYLNGDCFISVISGDGKSIVFESLATNNVNYGKIDECMLNQTNTCINIFKYNFYTNNVTLISTAKNNFGGNSNSISPSISYDGRYITFQSSATNIIDNKYENDFCKNIGVGEKSFCSHVYLHDQKENILKIVSSIDEDLFNDNSGNAKISGNGKIIVYETYATNIDENIIGLSKLIAYSIENQSNKIISKKDNSYNNRDSYLLDVSYNANYVLFESSSTNLNGSGKDCVYIYNLKNNKVDFTNIKEVDYIKFSNDKIIYYKNNILNIKKIDDIPPIIEKNQKIYILKDSVFSLKDKIVYDDNLSTEIEIYLENNLIFNEVGVFESKVTAIDEFDNIGFANITIVVLEKDDEGPCFSDIKEIRVLKGSSSLNLSNYINAKDNVDGYTKIYIVDEGNLNLNSAGEYKVKLMSKDASNNISYKDLYIVVYENYSFKYYYEILIILGIIVVIIFSIIKVK